jgi:60 kDa SS-A/Ro ribonucleoprotein
MSRYDLAATQRTPQRERARSDQVENNAGGYVFEADPWAQFDRFLILGAHGGTYYVNARQHLTDNLNRIRAVIDTEGARAVERICEISEQNRGVSNEPALVALAVATTASNKQTRKIAWANLSRVVRTGTHLFHFVAYRDQLAGWGRLATRGVSSWYENQSVGDLSYQMLKYQQRDGWSHRDVLRVAHPKAPTDSHSAMYDVACGRTPDAPLPPLYDAVRLAREGDIEGAIARGATREMLPTEALGNAKTWELLLHKLPGTAFLRNLANMTRLGVFSNHEALVHACDRLESAEFPQKARIHPYQALVALKAYQSGGTRGRSHEPLTPIIAGLERLLANSWQTVRPTNKRFLIGLDVSGSMWMRTCGQSLEGRLMLPGEAAAAVTLAIAKAERFCQTMAFSRKFHQLPITSQSSFTEVLMVTKRLLHEYGATDCALPVTYAQAHNLQVDVFLVITDNESWAGPVHVHQALAEYRRKINPDARMIVLAMTATRFSVADPNDPLSLDIVGMDAAVPKIITEFAQG